MTVTDKARLATRRASAQVEHEPPPDSHSRALIWTLKAYATPLPPAVSGQIYQYTNETMLYQEVAPRVTR